MYIEKEERERKKKYEEKNEKPQMYTHKGKEEY